jgi:hypothetical protein
MENAQNFGTWNVWMLVDTGASLSTLTGEWAGKLSVGRRIRRFGDVKSLQSASGRSVVGVLRSVVIYLGAVHKTVPVLVEIDACDTPRVPQDGSQIGSPPRHNVLGMAGVLDSYLLCLDAGRLYAFPKGRD